jgi:hypothetical protein
VSARAWILFLGLGSVVTAGAWSYASAHAAVAPIRVRQAHISLDLDNQACRLVWLEAGQESAGDGLAAVVTISDSRR